MASASPKTVAVPEYTYLRFGRRTPRLKARLQPHVYRRCNGDEVRISEMHDYHIVNAVAKIRRELVFGVKSDRHTSLSALQQEANKRGFTVL